MPPTTFACGAVLLAAGHFLASPFAVPEAALRVIGAAFVLWPSGI